MWLRLDSGRCFKLEPPHESRIGNLLQPRIRRERREEACVAHLKAFAPCGAADGGRADRRL